MRRLVVDSVRAGEGSPGVRRHRQRAGAAVPASWRREPWEKRYRNAVICADGAVTVSCVCAAAAAGVSSPYGRVLAPVTVVVFLLAALGCRAWRPLVLGQGAEEFRRLVLAAFLTLVALGLGCFATGLGHLRPWPFAVVPAIALLCLPLRYGLRKVLHRARVRGRCLLPVLAAGSAGTVADLVTRTRALPHVGWRVAAACVPGHAEIGSVSEVPVVGASSEMDIAALVADGGYRVVAVTPDPYWTPERLRRLAWGLEGTRAEMVVAPTLMEVAGPRLHVSAVLGLPLLRVSEPKFSGMPRLVKSVVDKVGAALLVLAFAPLALGVAASIALTDSGPVFYRQRRVGRDGQAFRMLKFRTMVVGADRMRGELAARDEGAGPLFKLRDDPRVTRVGAWLRRYSLDELPQLLNVLAGHMSLVGPRPPLPDETESYGEDTRRRLLVKPGLTGLWQVSGRSDLSWEDSVRLDLRYVEDWSLALDAVILWKTARAVLRGNGAY